MVSGSAGGASGNGIDRLPRLPEVAPLAIVVGQGSPAHLTGTLHDLGISPTFAERYFRHFDFGAGPDLARLMKAWRNTGQRVALAESGGDEAAFPGRRIFPYRFLLKHYPIRSQAHGERKVLRERQARWNASRRARE